MDNNKTSVMYMQLVKKVVTVDVEKLNFADTFQVFSDILCEKLYTKVNADKESKMKIMNVTGDNLVYNFFDYCKAQEEKEIETNVISFMKYKKSKQ